MTGPRLTIAAFALGLFACKPPPTPPPSVVFVRVLDESKLPVDKAEITSLSRVITTTNDEGRAEVSVTGREGATYVLDVRCPSGYRSPEAPLEVRRLDSRSASPPEYVTHCTRLRHNVVVLIKTVGIAGGLRVLHLGKSIARTDAEGKARVVLEGDVHEQMALQIDTSDKALAKVHPQSPAASFEIANRDGEAPFEVTFTRDAKPPPRAAKRTGPVAM